LCGFGFRRRIRALLFGGQGGEFFVCVLFGYRVANALILAGEILEYAQADGRAADAAA
jgi:hypothetical protein